MLKNVFKLIVKKNLMIHVSDYPIIRSIIRKCFFLCLLSISGIIIFTSCAKENLIDNTVNKPQLQGTGFTYQNQIDFTLNMTFQDMQGNPISLTKVDVYDQNPMVPGTSNWRTDINPFTEGQTDNNGLFAKTFSLGTNVDTIYVVLNNLTYATPIVVPIQGTSASIVMRPSGYGVLRSESSIKSFTSTYSIQSYENLSVLNTMPNGEAPWHYTVSPFTSSNLWVLGNFDAVGFPSYLDSSDTISSSAIKTLSKLLPERVNEMVANPSLFSTDPLKSNFVTTAKCQIWVSFISEGAAYQDVLGYFYYPTGSTPSSVSNIDKRIIVFPNASYPSSVQGGGWGNGSMVMGDRVRLAYYNNTLKQWTDTFPAGVSVSWFLISNGFTTTGYVNQGLANGNGFLYSIPALNSGNQQSLLLNDPVSNTFLLTFEDMPIISGNSDKDFNDVIFQVSANPITAINYTSLPILTPSTSTDADGDGVPDSNDAYPNDPQRAYDEYYPTSGYGTLAFEDQWPYKGDYDFNDLVLDYKYHLVLNAYYQVKDVKITYYVKAVGAAYRNGFAIQFGTGAGNVQSVSGQVNMAGNKIFSLSSVGYENGQDYAVIPVFPDASQLFGYTTGTPPFINTSNSGVFADSIPINLTITFGTPVDPKNVGKSSL